MLLSSPAKHSNSISPKKVVKNDLKQKTNIMGRILDSIYVRGETNISHLNTETANVQERH